MARIPILSVTFNSVIIWPRHFKNSLMTTTFLISKIKLYNSLIHVKIVLLCSEFQKILPFAGISASPPTNKSISSTEP